MTSKGRYFGERTIAKAGIMEEACNKTDRSVPWRDWNRDPRVIGTLALFLCFGGIILGIVTARFDASHVGSGPSVAMWVWTALTCLALLGGLASGLRAVLLLWRSDQEQLADSLPERARYAAKVLREATTLVQELQTELTARTALLEDVRRRVAETSQQAEELEKLSHIDDETARAFNNLLDQALKHRLDDLERGARQREWIIGTVVAVAVGFIAILVAHFAVGF